MKKNRMMRIASVLLVAVLMSTCAISGTFAKYVTTVNGKDSARVAKWGIGSDFTGASTFSAKYGTAGSEEISNGSDDGKNLVAPGAKDSGTYILNGTPEVAYQITFALSNIVDVFLKNGTYAYVSNTETAPGYTEKTITTTGGTYYPIKWTVTIATTLGSITDKDNVNNSIAPLSQGANYYDTLEEAKQALEETLINFDANEECDVNLTIAWNWAFTGQDQNDDADTILGNIIAGPIDIDGDSGNKTATIMLKDQNGSNYNEPAEYDPNNHASLSSAQCSCYVGYDLTITATQIAPQYS